MAVGSDHRRGFAGLTPREGTVTVRCCQVGPVDPAAGHLQRTVKALELGLGLSPGAKHRIGGRRQNTASKMATNDAMTETKDHQTGT